MEQMQGEEPHAEHCRHVLRALQSPADTGPSRCSISAGHCRWAGRLLVPLNLHIGPSHARGQTAGQAGGAKRKVKAGQFCKCADAS